MNDLKLYHFFPNDHGDGYVVVARSKEEALDLVKGSVDPITYNKWAKATVDNLPYNFTVTEHEVGDVLTISY